MNPARKRRLIIVIVIVAAISVAAALATWALQRNVTYLFNPTEVEAGKSPANGNFRLGGIVLEGSVKHIKGTLETRFIVTDRFHSLPVTYTGILPNLFREGQSIVTTGHMQDHTFVATQVLAKHDETYMPPQVAQAIKKAEEEGRTHAEMEARSHAAGKTVPAPETGDAASTGGKPQP